MFGRVSLVLCFICCLLHLMCNAVSGQNGTLPGNITTTALPDGRLLNTTDLLSAVNGTLVNNGTINNATLPSVNGTNCTSVGNETICRFPTKKKSGPGAKGRKVLEERYPEALFKAVYWEVKPYVFRNERGEMDGVYPTIFKNAMMFCGRRKNATLFNLYNASRLVDWEEFRMNTRRDFLRTFTSNSYPDGLVPGRDIYLPAIFRHTEEMIDIETKKRLMNFDIAKSNTLAIIVRRDYISLPYKIFRGIQSCGQIFFISALMTILFGVLIWLSERVNNPAFPSQCFVGTGTGVWWSFVSMTTVGYGDVVPNSIIGRFIAAIWVCIGVMIACIVTATVTEVVNGVSDLNLAHQNIAVLENSVEAERAETDFRAKLVQLPTYEAVYDAVREGVVYAAAVNAEVAAWAIEEIENDERDNPLRIVKLIPTELNLNMVFSRSIPNDFKPIIRCMHDFSTEVYNRAKNKFARYCPTETLYIESTADLFKSPFVQVLLGVVFLLICIGVSVDFFHRRFGQKKKGSANNGEAEMMIEEPIHMTTKVNGFV